VSQRDLLIELLLAAHSAVRQAGNRLEVLPSLREQLLYRTRANCRLAQRREPRVCLHNFGQSLLQRCPIRQCGHAVVGADCIALCGTCTDSRGLLRRRRPRSAKHPGRPRRAERRTEFAVSLGKVARMDRQGLCFLPHHTAERPKERGVCCMSCS
jgi:hypothetical protein